MFKAAQSSCTGTLFGYLVVHNQSIWYSVGAHFAWNLLMVLIVLIIYVILVTAYQAVKTRNSKDVESDKRIDTPVIVATTP